VLLKEAADLANYTGTNALAASSCSKLHDSANGYSLYCGHDRTVVMHVPHQHVNSKLKAVADDLMIGQFQPRPTDRPIEEVEGQRVRGQRSV
jgi:hypothetical protein